MAVYHYFVLIYRTVTKSRVHKNLSFGQEYYIGFLRYTTAITDPYLVRHFTADVQTPKKTEQCVIKKVNVPISDGSTVECAWFTNLNEDNLDSYDITILYFHGGGYIWGNSLMYSKSYETLLLNLKLQNKRARIFSGTYPLAPESVFPAQLNASVDVYKWLLANPSVRPESIVLAGESAGAHLALTLLFSLYKQKVELPSACVTISPVVDMTQTFETFPNNLTDYLAKESAASVPNYYLGANDSSSLRKNELVSPILASDKLLKGVFTESNLKKYLVAYGGQEVFSPEIKRWISRIEGLLTGVMDVDCDPDMVHIYQLLPEAFPTHAVNGIERIAKWIVSVL
ncbi:hypothetical protein HK098_002719 [Nowakowskiella sp. JEL0407]|nr:hypothetical protein HK098_002719 [Nowakowskiella sp. JEL0407]